MPRARDIRHDEGAGLAARPFSRVRAALAMPPLATEM